MEGFATTRSNEEPSEVQEMGSRSPDQVTLIFPSSTQQRPPPNNLLFKVSPTEDSPSSHFTGNGNSPSPNTTNANISSSSSPSSPPEPESLMDKFREHYHKGSPKGSKAKIFARVFFQFQALTFLVMVLTYLTPYAMGEFGETADFCFRILVWYIFIIGELNWIFAIITESDLPDTSGILPKLPGSEFIGQDNSITDTNHQSEFSTPADQSSLILLPRVDENGLVWKYCDICEKFRPPRTYHCKFCRKCILRRDHHCHLIGKCIGHYNQRYFVVLCFYTLLTSAVGFPITASYLANLPEAASWTYYILPYTSMLFIFRYVSFHFLLLTFNAYVLFIFGLVALFYWLGQLSIISMGKTLVEVIKQMDVKVSSSLSENFDVVFGSHWFLSFVFPYQGLFRQTHDGIHFIKVKIYGKKEEKI